MQFDVELLAPAGSYESLQAAIQGGADAVYFGAGNLNMRSRSSHNFSASEISEVLTICKSKGIKAYLTLNTILYDQDLSGMDELLIAALEAKVDAVIVSDLAAINRAFELGLKVHISTQANITNLEAVKFYSRFADVMVLARELTLEQVAFIAREIKNNNITGPSGNLVRLEVFIHGALCMAVSGKCYLSLHQQGVSANRGECLQICRRAYTVKDKETGQELQIDNEYIMSPADLCTIGFLDHVLESGVQVLKIEGRARSPEYVKIVTRCYREAIEAIKQEDFSSIKIDKWQKELDTVFNRGFWDGYYLGRKLGVWSEKYGSRATHRKVYVGKITNYFSKLQVAELLVEAKQLNRGEKVIITGPTTGVLETAVEEIRLDLGAVETTSKGDLVSFKVPGKVRRNDQLYKIVEVG
jgi:putative protease